MFFGISLAGVDFFLYLCARFVRARLCGVYGYVRIRGNRKKKGLSKNIMANKNEIVKAPVAITSTPIQILSVQQRIYGDHKL